MKYSELKQHIISRQGSYAPLYLVYGSDEYLVGEAVKQFKALIDPDFADFNYASFLQADGMDAVLDALSTFPVFTDIKAVVLTLKDKLSEADLAMIKSYLASPSDSALFIIRCDYEHTKQIKHKSIESVVCNGLEDDELRALIRTILDSEPKGDMTKDAMTELITRTQGSAARIVSETEKLKAYTNQTITKTDVQDMVSADLDYQIYMLTEAVSTKDGNKALTILTALLNAGVKSKVIVDNLYDRYRRILHVALNKDASNDYFAERFFVKPTAVYYLRRSAENYTQVKLKNIVDSLHALQYDILQGRRDDESAMHEAIISLLEK